MSDTLKSVSIQGFKSIRDLTSFPLRHINVLIGSNGAGKSNFVSFFTLLREIVEGRLETAINKAGGADIHLFLGPKVTDKIEADLEFGMNGYKCVLEPTDDNRLIFADERIKYHAGQTKNGYEIAAHEVVPLSFRLDRRVARCREIRLARGGRDAHARSVRARPPGHRIWRGGSCCGLHRRCW